MVPVESEVYLPQEMRIRPSLMQKRQVNPFAKSCVNATAFKMHSIDTSRTSLNGSFLPKLDKSNLRYNVINIMDEDVFQPRELDLSKSFIDLDAGGSTSQFRSYTSSTRPKLPEGPTFQDSTYLAQPSKEEVVEDQLNKFSKTQAAMYESRRSGNFTVVKEAHINTKSSKKDMKAFL